MRVLTGIWKKKVNGEVLDYYPCPFMVGDIFITTSSIKPEIRYPGTEWEELPEETYLVTASSKYQVKSIFGENEHTLTIDEMPTHTHGTRGAGNAQFANGGYTLQANNSGSNPAPNAKTSSTGGGQPHNNMPKSYAIYAYLRIA